MSVPSVLVLTWLGHATAAVSVAAAVVWLLLRLTHLQSPVIHRFAWFAVLLQAIVFWRVSVELPVLPRVDVARTAAGSIIVSDGQRSHDNLLHQLETVSASDWPTTAKEVPTVSGWPSVLLGGWLCAMVAVVARACFRYVTFCRALPRPIPARTEWTEELKELCHELAIPNRVSLQVTEQLGPALCLLPGGYRLLVPESAWRVLSAVQRQAILRHELAHCLRGDLWKSLLIRVLSLPQWFNPLAWHAARKFDEAAEWACDDAVQTAERDHVFEYLRALVQLGDPQREGTSLQAAIRGGSLQFRVRRLSFPSGKESKMKKFAVVTVIMAIAAIGLTQLQLATAQNPPSSNRGEPSSFATAENAPRDTISAAASLGSATPSSSVHEAVIDLDRVFKESRAFQRRKEALRKKLSQWQRELKEERERLAVLQEKQRTVSDGELKRLLEIELQADKAALERRSHRFQKDALDEEAAAYHETFERIRSEVAQYAKQNGIRLVRRSHNLSSIPTGP